MSRKFKSQASSARVASNLGGFGTFQTSASPLSYVAEQPDLNQISEPNVVVALKNLGKKDSTTKAKALDELLDSLKENTDIAVLTAWSDLYPRTSIDNSQIVRRNAHALQGQLTVNAGKKIAPLLPKLVPSWLAGTFDSDKSVAKAASDALDRSFTTPEKRGALWKLYKDAIYERIEDALLYQTANTLSDERTTSPDEAEHKYVRIVGTGIRLLSQLITDGLAKVEILQEKKLWDFAHHEDSYLRNAVCNLLLTALSRNTETLDWTVLSTSFLYKALSKSQMGSSRAYAQALCKLTEMRPTVWTTDYTAKTAASKRLLQYLRQGSQNGPQDVWSLLARLVQIIPSRAHVDNIRDAHDLAEAFRSGVLNERIHVDAAWHSYIEVCSWLCDQMTSEDKRDSFIEQNMIPIILSYVNRSADDKWRIGGRAEKTAVAAAEAILSESNGIYEKAWSSATDSTIEKMRLSLPESSKDFRTSQDAVAAQGRRLLGLQRAAGTEPETQKFSIALLHAALDLLKSRNGKPYGAASIVDDIAVKGYTDDDALLQFVVNDLPKLLDGPSCEQLVSLSLHLEKPVGLALLQSPSQSPNIVRGTECFLRNVSQSQLESERVQSSILDKIGSFESETSRAYVVSVLANPSLQDHEVKREVLSRLTALVSAEDSQLNALSMLETILSQHALARDLSSSDFAPQLSSKLLMLADSPDASLSDRANALTTALNARGDVTTSSIPIIRQQLSGTGDALSILTLTDLGLKSANTVETQELLPDEQDWLAALKPHFSSPTQSSLAITSPLRGAIWDVEPNRNPNTSVVRDAEDFSLLFRIVFFVTKVLIANKDKLAPSVGPRNEALYQYLPIALQLVNEKVTLDSANDIWLGSTDEVLSAAADVLSEGSQLLEALRDDEGFMQYWLAKGHQIDGTSREDYLGALAFLNVVGNVVNRQPKVVSQEYEEELQKIYKSENILQSSALLAADAESLLATQAGVRVVNELISDITQRPSHFTRIVQLNILLRIDPTVLEKVQQQRLVFLFKNIAKYLKDEADGPKTLSECFVLASQVIPFVQDIYGEHWETLVSSLVDIWEFLASDDVAILHSSLLAYARLRRALKAEEVNDDLQEALSTNKSNIDAGLSHCLQALSTMSAEVDQPRSITAELLRRQLTGVVVPDSIDLFALLGSGLPAVRRAAYDIQHRTIPQKQEQLSVDLALDQKVAQLPDELLQLIADTADPQRYLLSWKIVFDHYPKASYKLREAYTANLKANGCADGLLDFLMEKLRITSGRPVDASRFDITDYDLDMSDSYDHDVQWLSVHLYFLCLSYVPGLVKDWFLQQKNRIKTPLESWTQKHMTPLIVSTSLATVTDWSSSQDKDDRPVEIKASPRGSEVVASIQVDPESPPISLSISLPSAYPLESPVVTSRNRVGVSEKNWQSWLRTFQIIIFSSGSIIEGLIAFRRNVQGALKGQSECAICYSIIGTDMQTPNKKCGTCKNMFHGVCLFRWFKSSNSSSCPLCRNNFNYA
ncbi:hypothetical protein PMZ80_007809 [Knufia obscura]|uniref:E3 ubiquitin-protein ligase listerin n=1 Tax=Knufia obscura TaxID=1635080 RepID=A0ABR0RJU3_9EURO|nr:hypothetical protein PMZ80_007809 [Knufia obscura]